MRTISYPVNRAVRNKTEDYRLLTENYQDIEGDLDSLAKDIKAGHAIAGGLLNGGKRCDSSFSGTDLLIIEFDNSRIKTDADGCDLDEDGNIWVKGSGKKKAKEYDPRFTLEDALGDRFTSSNAALIYTSPSHTEEWNRFRIIFSLPYRINDGELARSATLLLMQHYGDSDPSCKDLCRAWFGNTNAEFYIHQDLTLPESFLEDVLKYHTSRIEALENARKRRESSRKLLNRASAEDCIDVKALVRQALPYCSPREPGTNTYSTSLAILTAIKSVFGDAEGRSLAENWSPSTKGWMIDQKWDRLRDGYSPGVIFKAAKQNGWEFPKNAQNLRTALNRIAASEKEVDTEKAVQILESNDPLPISASSPDADSKPNFDETIDQFDTYISQYANDLERSWEADNFAFDHKLTQRRITGSKLLTLSQARKDGNGDLVVIDALDLLERNNEGRKWLVAGTIPLGTTMVLAASGGSGKTTILYNIAKCIATGKKWSGFRVRKGRVLVIQADEPECDVAEKLDIADFHDIPRGSIDFILDWRFTQIRQIKELIQVNNYSFIIIDSWTATHSGTGTDLIASTAGDNMYKLRNIAQEFPCTFAVVHHFNKNNDLRDSSTMNDNVSEVWKLNNWEEKDHITRDQRILEISKSRAGLSGKYVLQQNVMDYSWSHLGRYDDRDSPGDPAMAQILQVLEANAGQKLSVSQLKEHLFSLDISTIGDTVESLRRIGMCDSEQVVRSHPNGEVSRYRLYSLPANEQVSIQKQGRHLYAI
jgi:AAA domain